MLHSLVSGINKKLSMQVWQCEHKVCRCYNVSSAAAAAKGWWLLGWLAGWVMKRKMRSCKSSKKKKQSWAWSYTHWFFFMLEDELEQVFHCLARKNCQQNQPLLEQIVYTARDIRIANRISHNAEAKLLTLRDIRSANRIISHALSKLFTLLGM